MTGLITDTALTEPDAGSNSHNVSTTARRAGDGWVLAGARDPAGGWRPAWHPHAREVGPAI